jgi:hypothetical protein
MCLLHLCTHACAACTSANPHARTACTSAPPRAYGLSLDTQARPGPVVAATTPVQVPAASNPQTNAAGKGAWPRGPRNDGSAVSGPRRPDGGWTGGVAGNAGGQSFRHRPRVCAICLGTAEHNRSRCAAAWQHDGRFQTIAGRGNDGKFLVKSRGKSVVACLDFNIGRTCHTTTGSHGAHVCSGCGDSGHGAQVCGRAQSA